MARILIVTDNNSLSLLLKKTLALDYHETFIVSAATVESYLSSIDMVIMDVTPGSMDAEDLQRSVLAHRVPAVVVLALLDENQARLFGDGVTDFIIKPLREVELRTRVKRLIEKKKAADHEVIRSGYLAIDVTNCDVTLAGRVIDLTFTEYQLLKYLASHAGRVLTREAILGAVWGHDYYGGDRTVDVHIQRLRGKIDDGQGGYIQTVRNIGYRFISRQT